MGKRFNRCHNPEVRILRANCQLEKSVKSLFRFEQISDTKIYFRHKNFDLYKHEYFRLEIPTLKNSHIFDSKSRLLQEFSYFWSEIKKKIIFWVEISIISNFYIFDSKLILFQLYEIDDESGRKDFLDELFTFMQKRGKKYFLLLKKSHNKVMKCARPIWPRILFV